MLFLILPTYLLSYLGVWVGRVYRSTNVHTGIPPHPPTTSIPHRYSIYSQTAGTENAARQARSASVVSTPRYEEVAHYRQELEEAKRENEALKRRIRELERALRGGEGGDGERGRTGGPGE